MSIVQKAVAKMKERGRATPQPTPQYEPLGHVVEDAAEGSVRVNGTRVRMDPRALRKAGFLPPKEYERQLAEEYRHVKRPLLANAFGIGVPKVENGNLIMIASAVSGEGKTHTCINLALSMAQEQDRTVLLIDADVAKPTVSRLFGLGRHPGLLDLLAGQVTDLHQVLVKTDVPKLRLMPAGTPREHATELLASNRMREISEELESRYPDRVILFDSAPLLATSESVVLAGIVGQIAMVVAAESTPKDAVREAMGRLDPDKAINFILNKARHHSGADYYGYGAYGFYGDRYGPQGTADGGRVD